MDVQIKTYVDMLNDRINEQHEKVTAHMKKDHYDPKKSKPAYVGQITDNTFTTTLNRLKGEERIMRLVLSLLQHVNNEDIDETTRGTINWYVEPTKARTVTNYEINEGDMILDVMEKYELNKNKLHNICTKMGLIDNWEGPNKGVITAVEAAE